LLPGRREAAGGQNQSAQFDQLPRRKWARIAPFIQEDSMSKGQWAFRPAALTRAIKAAEKAGKNVVGAKIDSVTGTFELRFQKSDASATQGEGNEWDQI
jgi:hypothetical protein